MFQGNRWVYKHTIYIMIWPEKSVFFFQCNSRTKNSPSAGDLPVLHRGIDVMWENERWGVFAIRFLVPTMWFRICCGICIPSPKSKWHFLVREMHKMRTTMQEIQPRLHALGCICVVV